MTDGHVGVLAESEYGFWCWTVCSCGWRSASYKTSDKAWVSFHAHVDTCIPETVVLDAYWEAFNRNHRGTASPAEGDDR